MTGCCNARASRTDDARAGPVRRTGLRRDHGRRRRRCRRHVTSHALSLFASKEDLVLGKYEILGDRLAEALAARPHDEPIWLSLRRTFDIVVEYFADDPDATRTVAME